MKDIAPELLEKIKNDFEEILNKNLRVKELEKKLAKGKTTYSEANEYSIEVGKALSQSFKNNLSSEILPDGKMYYNIADRIIQDRLKNNHKLISKFSKETQTQLNKKAGLNIQGVEPEINQNRIDGIVNRISEEEKYDDIKWILDEPVINFSQSIVDETINANVKLHHKLGLQPKIVRTSTGKCCDWCSEVVGIYRYPDEVPDEIYKRHRYCRCKVDYHPGDGKIQNVHSKKWYDPEKDDKIKQRKILSEKESSNKNLNKETRIDRNIIFSNSYDRKFNKLNESDKVLKNIKEKSREILTHRDGTLFEDLVFIDSKTGEYKVSHISEEFAVNPTKSMKKMIKESEPHTLIGIHNHPNSTFPSGEDIFFCCKRKYKYGIIVGHNGDIIKYEALGNFTPVDGYNYNIQLDKFNKKGYTQDEYIELVKKAFNVNLEVL